MAYVETLGPGMNSLADGAAVEGCNEVASMTVALEVKSRRFAGHGD